MKTLEELLQERLDGVNVAGLEEASRDQKHLNEGTPERAYWHHGYAMALKDTLRMLRASDGMSN